ncbi:MAG: nucleoside recognition domain-containing protein [Dethiobacteria bacterium]|mgnify:CR=1 FL=1
MVNLLWAGMIIASIIIAAVNGKMEIITPLIFASAEQAVNIALGLISVMVFWLGMMKVIEKSGFIHIVIFFLKPLAHWLFPGVPRNHKAMNVMLMNMGANLLGMGNAATPFGIKAMKELQSLNSNPDTATDDMCTFLAVNTASLTLIPTTIIAIRAATGAQNPADVIGTTIAATFCSASVAILSDRFFRYCHRKKNKREMFNCMSKRSNPAGKK